MCVCVCVRERERERENERKNTEVNSQEWELAKGLTCFEVKFAYKTVFLLSVFCLFLF